MYLIYLHKDTFLRLHANSRTRSVKSAESGRFLLLSSFLVGVLVVIGRKGELIWESLKLRATFLFSYEVFDH